MKNEDRIVELLAESLKKQDQQAEQLNSVVQALHDLTDIVKVAVSKFEKISDLEDRVNKLEKHTGLK